MSEQRDAIPWDRFRRDYAEAYDRGTMAGFRRGRMFGFMLGALVTSASMLFGIVFATWMTVSR